LGQAEREGGVSGYYLGKRAGGSTECGGKKKRVGG